MRHLVTGTALAVALMAGSAMAQNPYSSQPGSTNWSNQYTAPSGQYTVPPGPSGFSGSSNIPGTVPGPGLSGSSVDTGSGSGSSTTTTNTYNSTTYGSSSGQDESFGRGGSNQTATGTHCLPGERTCGPER